MVWNLERESHISSKCFLVGNFTVEDIKKETFELPKDRAPSLDGFPLVFFQHCCETIKDDLVSFSEFHSNGKLPRRTTHFLNINPQENRSFCHKGLSTHKPKTAPYKILAKVVSNRIREIIHEDIDGNKFAFVKDRNIIDCIFIANEGIEYNHRQKKNILVFSKRLPYFIPFLHFAKRFAQRILLNQAYFKTREPLISLSFYF